MLLPCAETSSRSPRGDRRRERRVPERQHARDGVLQALGERHLLGRQRRVARVAALAARVVGRERRRRHVVAAPPGEHLRVAELGARSRPCRGPAARRSGARSGASRCGPAARSGPSGRARARASRSRASAPRCRRDRTRSRLPSAAGRPRAPARRRRRQVDVGPAGEAVVEVPGRFAVAKRGRACASAEAGVRRRPRRERGDGRTRARRAGEFYNSRFAGSGQRPATTLSFVLENWYLFAAALVSGGLLLWPTLRRRRRRRQGQRRRRGAPDQPREGGPDRHQRAGRVRGRPRRRRAQRPARRPRNLARPAEEQVAAARRRLPDRLARAARRRRAEEARLREHAPRSPAASPPGAPPTCRSRRRPEPRDDRCNPSRCTARRPARTACAPRRC